MNKESKIYIAGHRGLVGSALVRNLEARGFTNIICRTHKELDLTNQNEVRNFFETEKPEYVFLAAAKVGGIHANNTYPADFIYDNLMIQNNIIQSAYENKVDKLLFLGSSCIYPRNCTQPMKEEDLLSGYLEPTNEAYALAKIAGLKMCEYYNKQYNTNFISCMPTNIYGENDNFNLETSHVIPAMMRRFHEAKINEVKQVYIWGTGEAMREFLFVDDLADACIYLMDNHNDNNFINVGTGVDVTIRELTELMKRVVGYEGELIFDTTKPEGNPRKLLDVSKLGQLGWIYKVGLEEGLQKTYEWFKKNI